jgi:flagellar export protein FliJ
MKGLLKLEQDRVAQLSRVLEARKGREMVEKLRDDSLSEYKKETQALEQKMLDDLSATQFGRLDKQDLPGASSSTRKS